MQSYLGALNNYDGDSNEKFKQRNGLKFAREPHYLEKFVAFTVPVRTDIPQRIFLSRIKNGEATKNIATEKFNIRHWKRVGIMVTKFEKRKPFKFLLLSLTRISPSQTVVAIFNGRCNPLVTKPLVMVYVIYSLDYVTRRRIIRFWIVLEKTTLKTRLNLR